ncbi:protein YgfX [Shewanella algidipiscicola]|uniref:protein YgfX n=1 Tax=Shewanella algidipiscicola TaxID=614070 RepID=UPI0013A559DB|nr:protein YgfX [Shewanella algidipiscicola]
MVVVAAVCFTSFLAWPPVDVIWFIAIKWSAIALVVAVFIGLWIRLQRWSFSFWLDESGNAGIGNNAAIYTLKRRWITPLMVLFEMHKDGDKHLVMVWRDMLDDTSYRYLCRLLLRFG